MICDDDAMVKALCEVCICPCWEILDSVHIFPEGSNIALDMREVEFVRVEDYLCSANEDEVICGPPPMILGFNILVNDVIYASHMELAIIS